MIIMLSNLCANTKSIHQIILGHPLIMCGVARKIVPYPQLWSVANYLTFFNSDN